ncbi:MAG: hypothetical protein ABF714_08165, partial [Novacetimonas hansenii]|uniref:hypothetical protein n=1 Tax=Novacetimonas hansenii TaxID=436 RepID=UPI0039EA46AA
AYKRDSAIHMSAHRGGGRGGRGGDFPKTMAARIILHARYPVALPSGVYLMAFTRQRLPDGVYQWGLLAAFPAGLPGRHLLLAGPGEGCRAGVTPPAGRGLSPVGAHPR